MAREIYQFSVTVPPSTLASAFQTTPMNMPSREVTRLEVEVPPGPRGEVGFAIGASGDQIIPQQRGQWIVSDDYTHDWDLDGFHNSGSWQMFIYNTGRFSHTLQVRFYVQLVGGAVQPTQVLLDNLVLSSGGSSQPAPSGNTAPPTPTPAPVS